MLQGCVRNISRVYQGCFIGVLSGLRGFQLLPKQLNGYFGYVFSMFHRRDQQGWKKLRVILKERGVTSSNYFEVFWNISNNFVGLSCLCWFISVYFGISWSISVHLGISTFNSVYLGLSWAFLGYLGLSWTITDYRRLSQLSRTILSYLGLSRTISYYLKRAQAILDFLRL